MKYPYCVNHNGKMYEAGEEVPFSENVKSYSEEATEESDYKRKPGRKPKSQVSYNEE